MLDALRALGCSVVHHETSIDVTELGRLVVSGANPSVPAELGFALLTTSLRAAAPSASSSATPGPRCVHSPRHWP